MGLLTQILSDSIWQGIGVILAVLMGLLGFYFAGTPRNKRWLYAAVIIIAFIVIFGMGAEAQRRSTESISSIISTTSTASIAQTTVSAPVAPTALTSEPMQAIPTPTEVLSSTNKKILFIDDFQSNRPQDTMSLIHTNSLSLTADISGNQLIAKVNSRFLESFYDSHVSLNDFDLVIDIDSYKGNQGSFYITFRYNKDAWQEEKYYNLWINILGSQKNDIFIDSVTTNNYRRIQDTHFDGDNIRQLEVRCKGDVCEVYVNSSTRVISYFGFSDIPGSVRLGMSGDYSIRINSITMNTVQ